MVKQFAKITILSLVLASVLALPVLADDTNTNTNTNTNTSTGINVSCIQTAIDKRDNAIIAAVDKHATTIKDALATRRDALKAAWAITDRKARRQAIKDARTAYTKTVRQSRKDLNAARKATWKQYYKDRKACGKGITADDRGAEGDDSQI